MMNLKYRLRNFVLSLRAESCVEGNQFFDSNISIIGCNLKLSIQNTASFFHNRSVMKNKSLFRLVEMLDLC